MKFGVCTSYKTAKDVMVIGFDYVELNLSEIAKLSETDFNAFLDEVKTEGIKVYSFNLFIPGTYRITGPDANLNSIGEYAEGALKRAKLLGAKIVVFGSGNSRRVPEGFDFFEAQKQLEACLLMCAECAKKYQLTLAIEPLNQKECNILTTAKETAALVRKLNHPNVKLLIDVYHKEKEGEDDLVYTENADLITHLHLAEPKTRSVPKNDEEFDYARWFEMLKTIGYDGRVSLEGHYDSLDKDLREALILLKKYI